MSSASEAAQALAEQVYAFTPSGTVTLSRVHAQALLAVFKESRVPEDVLNVWDRAAGAALDLTVATPGRMTAAAEKTEEVIREARSVTQREAMRRIVDFRIPDPFRPGAHVVLSAKHRTGRRKTIPVGVPGIVVGVVDAGVLVNFDEDGEWIVPRTSLRATATPS